MKKLVLLGLFSVLCACSEPLPGGVTYHWLDGGYHDLEVHRQSGLDEVVVEADVLWVKANGRHIYGMVNEYRYAQDSSSKPGYFILDTGTWKVSAGLSREEVSNRLGIDL